MSAEDKKQALQHFLSLLPETLRSELTPVMAGQLPQPLLLHISKDVGLSDFTPIVTRRTLDGENRSVPRISTAPTLTGCIMGYSADIHDFMERPTTMSADRKRRVHFRGGWAVYGFSYDIALRPSKKLLPDVEKTNEHWLVTYDEDSVHYKPQLLAKFFYLTVTHQANGGDPASEIEMLLEVLTDTPISFDGKRTFEKGCWKIKVTGMHSAKRFDKMVKVEAAAMAKPDYTASKRLVASMLSFEEMKPASAEW